MHRKRVTDSWYSTIEYRLTVADVHCTLCKQKQTLLLYVRQMKRKTREIKGYFAKKKTKTIH